MRSSKRHPDAARLVINEEVTQTDDTGAGELTTNTLQSIVTNLGVNTRHEKLEGKDYLVVPMVMLTEGVHAGSNGPLYYPKDELAKTPAVWNHKPIVVYHPTMNGQAVSACQPTVLNRRKVGLILNCQFEGGRNGGAGKLKAEAWLETNRLQEVDARVLKSLQKRSMVEVSTGLFTDNEAIEGTWKKEPYSFIARNYRPDHLAILPDQQGACSIADGAGLLRNAELSADEIRQQLNDAVQPKSSSPSETAGPTCSPCSRWVQDVYGTFCIYSEGSNKYFKQDYEIKDGAVKLKGSAVAVKRRQTYTTTDGTVVNTQTGVPMSKQQMVDQLVSNGKATEDDRDGLMALGRKTLEGMVANYFGLPGKQVPGKGGAEEEEEEPVKDEEEEEEEVPGKKPACNSRRQPTINRQALAPRPVTLDDYITNAPAEMQDVLRSSVQMHTQEKARLIDVITANEACTFTEEQLAAKPLEELQGIAALAANAAPAQEAPRTLVRNNYGGQGDAGTRGGRAPVTTNQEALPVPTLTFNRKQQ